MRLKAVVDTNIIVSGAIKPQGTVGAVLQRLRRRDYLLLLSRATLDEVVEVLRPQKNLPPTHADAQEEEKYLRSCACATGRPG